MAIRTPKKVLDIAQDRIKVIMTREDWFAVMAIMRASKHEALANRIEQSFHLYTKALAKLRKEQQDAAEESK